jgi:transcriptional regulator with XRE-family HTH domain
MDTIGAMDAQLDLEKLRAALKKLARKRVRALAISAGLAPSTVEKFRLGHITEPSYLKLQALVKALNTAQEREKAKPDNGKRRRSTDVQPS